MKRQKKNNQRKIEMISQSQIRRMGNAVKPIMGLIQFRGGLDQETPPLSLASGFLRASQNFECDVNGGYSVATGYERYDGQPSPSDAVASVIDITLTGTISVGDTVTGSNIGATAEVIVSNPTFIVVTKVSAAFIIGETLSVSGVQATTTSVSKPNSGASALLRAQYKNLAADVYRADIAAPTGSGGSLGGFRYNDITYAWRNNAGGTAANLWKSTASGWSQITFHHEISYTAGGATEPAEGTTLSQGGVTAVIKRVVIVSGTFALGTAAGRLIITTPAGGSGNFASGAATVGAINFTLSGVQTAITFQPSGRFEHIKANFAGGLSTIRIYGCDGANRGFEFDGTILVPITTGMATDTPSHVYAHKFQLFFAFDSSAQHSAPGSPFVWSVILGAAELAMGDTITGFSTQPGNQTSAALAIFTRNLTSILYGTGVGDWDLQTYRPELGAYEWSVQDVGYTIYLDDQGISNILTSQDFGNFSHDMLSARVKSWVTNHRSITTASCVSRDKSQYRLFFSNKDALYVTFVGRKIIGMMPIYFRHPVSWAYSSEDSDGTETIFFGSTDGMVYQMEKGTSYDGGAIDFFFNVAWDFLKQPRMLKRYVDAAMEISGNGYAGFTVGYNVGYSSTDFAQPTSLATSVAFSGAQWDEFVWDEFTWDGQALSPTMLSLGGEAENISFSIRGSSDYNASITFSGTTVNYIPRRATRG